MVRLDTIISCYPTKPKVLSDGKKIQLDYEDGHKEDGNDFDDHAVDPDPDYEDDL